MPSKAVDLDFSRKYDRSHSEQYLHKHQAGFWRKLSHERDVQIARKALKLAGQPNLVLDLPCGAGRFWPMLAEMENRVIIGADNSADMLAVACAHQPAEVVKRVRPLQTSAFAIDLSDNSVDSIFSMRLMHHIGKSEDRMTMLREFHRVTRDSVVLSLWVDGNLKSWKRKQLEAKRERRGYQNRFVTPARTIEAEFRQAGFVVQDHIDFCPLLHMWRVYILRKE
ncbi:class I SAM-dependent methyltransferase [Pseudomonas schmalbachii]|uniref:Class I SAM-dependent methyltransferase n=1 Tax=Pseudomonas schmalbachii TaxID=2816993 RepID=A0ABS3TWE8_9PSED|nr:class I SAM-dependent methyltransferase [Pseudomonas schmalbachii]MBO3277658.1 class I SAM-dependent methyltransferase [Pseudomonas schmalbachii]